MTTWPTIIVNGTSVLITGLSRTNNTFVVIAAPGESSQSHVLTVPPPPAAPAERYHLYLGISVACGAAALCAGAGLVLCAWRRRKRARNPRRARAAPDDLPAEEMTIIGDRLANGGGSKDAGEPLLNGHVHITENPTQSKTPNGKVRMAECYEDAFDVTRYDEADVTVETVLEADTSAGAYRPLDTARAEPTPYRPLDTARAEPTPYRPLDTARREPAPYLPLDTARRDSFTKLPDDNMNSEEPRGTVALGNSKLLPTLQPNG